MPKDELVFSDETLGHFYADQQIDEISKKMGEGLKHIKELDNPRIIILEKWIILDWFVRQIIVSGTGMGNHISAGFDAHYELLPRGFERCLEILKKFLENQRKLKPYPQSNYRSFSACIELWELMKNKYPQALADMKKAEREINSLSEDEMAGPNIIVNIEEYRSVSEDWLKSVRKLDDKWFSEASHLNTMRNYAAHSFDSEKIFKAAGINGKNRATQLRKRCIKLLADLVGIKR